MPTLSPKTGEKAGHPRFNTSGSRRICGRELQSGNEPCREFEDLGNLHKWMAVGIALRKVTSAQNVTKV